MRNIHPRVAVIILAAGSSQRMSSRKQLIRIDGESLVRRTVRIALGSEAAFVVVALRQGDVAVQAELDGLDIQFAWVESPELGQSESLRTGLEQASESGANAILVSPCDLPLLTSEHLNQLIFEYSVSDVWIVASRYDGVCGAPMILADHLWEEVRNLRGDVGARKIISQFQDKMTAVDWADGSTDLDTLNDLEDFLGRKFVEPGNPI